MPVQIETGPEVVSAFLSGEIDHHNARSLRTQIDEAAVRVLPGILRLDFSSVDFMDSSGIGLVLGRYQLMKDLGGQLTVTGLPPYLRKVMTVAGIDKLGIVEEENHHEKR